MKADALWIVEPGLAEVRSEELPDLPAGQVLVRTEVSAFSPGTERLFFRGGIPQDMPVDSHLPGMQKALSYPLKYGYSAVGQVVEVGSAVDRAWLGERVFAFQPHQTHFLAPVQELVPIGPDLTAEEAAFLPGVETALTFAHDGRPLAGERVVLHGLGMIGLLTTSLLASFPLSCLVTVDPVEDRRERSLARGAHAALDPRPSDAARRLTALLGELSPPPRADLSYELSGAPAALNLAIETTAFSGRIVVGSWYGDKPVSLDLGGSFHRSRLDLISSQVSTIDPSLLGRWTKDRRMREALRLLPTLRPSELITHRLPFGDGPQAYGLLDSESEGLAMILTYDNSA